MREKTPVQLALRALREKLGTTQQQLASLLGVASVSVCRWETSRPPSGLALLRLETLARSFGAVEAAQIFEEALVQELPGGGTIFRIRFSAAGGHVRCRVFVADAADRTFACCGAFTVRDGAEFEAMQEAFRGVEFVRDDPLPDAPAVPSALVP